jgi:putative membrane protein
MSLIAVAAAIVAALLHVYIFALESLWFRRPTVWRRFGITSDSEARVVESFAFNQGFYNLFLAVGIAVGLGLVAMGSVEAGRAIVAFACASMVAAGTVLAVHNRSMVRAAALQITPGLVALVAIVLL